MSDAAQQPPAAPDFNPFSPEFQRDPYPAYRFLRENQPLYWAPIELWIATRHEDVAMVLRDRRFGKDYEARMKYRQGEDVFDQPCYAAMRRMMLVADPPDHTRLRGLVVKAFTARRVEEMRPRIQQLVDGLLDAVVDRGHMDVIRDFAHPLPTNVICDMLGIPEEEREQFIVRSRVSGRLIDPTPMTPEELEEANQNSLGLADYFKGLFERRRKDPRDDLTTHLVQAEEQGQKLSEEELTSNIILLFGAGHDTTVNLIGNGLLALHRAPDQLKRLIGDPSLIPNAVEELLRFDSSVQMTSRTALEDVEVNGTVVKKGQSVIAILGSANRDLEAYDDPDRLDVGRQNIKLMSFGGGIHFCLGAQLARIEAEIAFATFLKRLPDLRLEAVDDPDWRSTFTLRGLKSLPASWPVPR